MVKDVTKFQRHLGGQGMLECACVGFFLQDFEFRKGGRNSKVWC